MSTPTLSQLADIGAAAAYVAIDGTHVCMLDTMTCYSDHRPAREAFVKAVLDAVGYKFPVDPEREAFDAWMKEHESADLTYFEAWKAGRAAVLAEQVDHEVVMPHFDSGKSQPETFEAHGLTWIKHTPGDPMPCDGTSAINCLFEGRSGNDDPTKLYVAGGRHWGVEDHRCYPIVGWRYADTP